MLLQGHGEGFSMFSADNGQQGYAEGKAGSIWGDSQSRAANMDHYTQLLQQGPAVRSSLDSRSSGGLFGGRSTDYIGYHLSLHFRQPRRDQSQTRQLLPLEDTCRLCMPEIFAWLVVHQKSRHQGMDVLRQEMLSRAVACHREHGMAFICRACLMTVAPFAGQPELYQQGSGGLRQDAMFASQASASPGPVLHQSSPWAASPLGNLGTHGSIWSSMPSERCSSAQACCVPCPL